MRVTSLWRSIARPKESNPAPRLADVAGTRAKIIDDALSFDAQKRRNLAHDVELADLGKRQVRVAFERGVGHDHDLRDPGGVVRLVLHHRSNADLSIAE